MGSKTDLHCGQYKRNEDGGRRDPSDIVAEETGVVVAAAEVGFEEREAGEAVDGVEAGEAQLGAVEAGVGDGLVALVYAEEVSGKSFPGCPVDGGVVIVAREEAQFVGEVEVAFR